MTNVDKIYVYSCFYNKVIKISGTQSRVLQSLPKCLDHPSKFSYFSNSNLYIYPSRPQNICNVVNKHLTKWQNSPKQGDNVNIRGDGGSVGTKNWKEVKFCMVQGIWATIVASILFECVSSKTICSLLNRWLQDFLVNKINLEII